MSATAQRTGPTATTAAPALEIRGLTVAYGRRAVLRDVTFAVPRGCLVGVIGPNGAGKSTLFKAVLGLVPRSGEVGLPGRAAYVPQGDLARLDLPLTALDVALMGRHRGRPWWRPMSRADRDAARAALAVVGMADHCDVPFGELSGGQRQRVVLARALAGGGDVVLLDEPLTGVDAQSEEAILGILRDLRAEGRAVLMATHDIAQAAAACDRLLFLNGDLMAYGSPAETLTREVLSRTYGGDLVVLDGGNGVGVLDHGGHHPSRPPG
jgi:ABC-type Mn2+/Zn2+ transport system ATPase subunit